MNIIRLICFTLGMACLTFFFSRCHCTKMSEHELVVQDRIAGEVTDLPKIRIYKTTKDYSTFVPVILDESRTKIVSYPHPTDIYYAGKLAYPTPLQNGYLLDNRGIGPNVAFLNIDYENYSRLKSAPSMTDMLKSILDNNPLLELWECGSLTETSGNVDKLNDLISKGFPGCKQIIKRIY
jgi:hypothetical protein